jgi:hypothetical protein
MSESVVVRRPDWNEWQQEIVRLLRGGVFSELQSITTEDIDWISWQYYYFQGRSPRQAIERALERDL